MVQLMKSGHLRPEFETAACREKVAVKMEDCLEEEHGPLTKRPKPSFAFQQRSLGDNAFAVPPSQYNPLDEPSPLGLRLRKSPSLLELIQMKLSHGGAATSGAVQSENVNYADNNENKATAASGTTDKLKASNFPALLLRIGGWEYKSRYEGDLVAKCYFAKHKLVWEVLQGGLKSKIEIQWSDIMALKANCLDDGPGTLTVVLARQPLFFRETNPQPRKHTLWQATADFTDGQATIHRQHFLQCPQGLLNKHFEKLIQCDTRLCFLSRQPEIVLESPYFEARTSPFEDPDESTGHGFDKLGNCKGSSFAGFSDVASPSAGQSSTLKIDQQDSASTALEHQSREAPSPSLVMDAHAIEGNGSSEAVDSRGPKNWEKMKVSGLHPSMSMGDLMSHIGNCISEQMTSGNPPSADQQSEYQDILEDIAQYLLSDTQFTTASDENSLMLRVNSLCCLLQKDPAVQNTQVDGKSCVAEPDGETEAQLNHTPGSKSGADMRDRENDIQNVSGGKKAPGMSRKDSFGELLSHLPRIASLPSFPRVLFNISEEDCESQDK